VPCCAVVETITAASAPASASAASREGSMPATGAGRSL
jgi:hypothetical protein